MAFPLSRLAPIALPLLLLAAPVPALSATPVEAELDSLAKSGSGEAAYHLGMLYHLGLVGTPKDARKAYDLFKLSAELGDPLGAYKLGCFYDGQGEGVVESNAELALKYKTQAAAAGYSLAQQEVARHLFAKGDMEGALRWLEAAAAQGDAMALMVLGSFYSGQMPEPAPPVPADRVKSFAYLLLAAREMRQESSALETEMANALTVEERGRVSAIVDSWRATPTPLTAKAHSGLDAAYRLAGIPAPEQ